MKVKTLPIEKHPEFKELAAKYAYDPKTKQFPARLPDGRRSLIAGVTSFFRTSK